MNPLRRGILGLVLIGLGIALVALNIRRSLEPVILTFTPGHGVHLTDLIGTIIAYAGAALIWTRGGRR
jgi:hypothetical protein